VSGALFFSVVTFGGSVRRWLRGDPAVRATWSFVLATRLVSAVRERRSWRAARLP
jgi:hypothetical protein